MTSSAAAVPLVSPGRAVNNTEHTACPVWPSQHGPRRPNALRWAAKAFGVPLVLQPLSASVPGVIPWTGCPLPGLPRCLGWLQRSGPRDARSLRSAASPDPPDQLLRGKLLGTAPLPHGPTAPLPSTLFPSRVNVLPASDKTRPFPRLRPR